MTTNSPKRNVYTVKKLAVWFGNESEGISTEGITNLSMSSNFKGCLQLEMLGITESHNLSICYALVMSHIATTRRQFTHLRHIENV